MKTLTRTVVPVIGFLGLLTCSGQAQGPTVIRVSDSVLHDHVKRFGMNIGGETFYGSSQILDNLVSRNPGFEPADWQSIVRCAHVSGDTCVAEEYNSPWPAGFLDGASFEVLSGTAEGSSGKVMHNTAADKARQAGVTLQFAPAPKGLAEKDFIVVRKHGSGDPAGGWWPQLTGGATITAETKDLSPQTTGTQALHLTALLPRESAALNEYFDSTSDRAFLKLRGPFTLSFLAKGLGGKNHVSVQFARLGKSGREQFFQKDIPLTTGWKQYDVHFTAKEQSNSAGTLALTFMSVETECLLDDVSLGPDQQSKSAFRKEVVAALRALNPGVLRFMDGETLASSFDNLVAPDGSRRRSGYSIYSTESPDVPIGLSDFLALCETVGAEPWYTLPLGMSAQEARDVLEFLGGPVTTKYGAKRAALGHPEPWTRSFTTIHLELGNETWNTLQRGVIIPDPVAYGQRTAFIFNAMRSSRLFGAGHYDLVADGFAVNTYWNQKVLDTASGYDTIDIAPYLFANFQDASSVESIFGPMFAQPEMMDSTPRGIVRQQALIAAKNKRPAGLSVYEVNLHTTQGTVNQAALNSTVPSIAAGLTVIDHMLLMLRDDGVTTQNVFTLAGSEAPFRNNASPSMKETSAVWGSVVDMGGPTNRVRPLFLAETLANQAIRSSMLAASVTGVDPTWKQPFSANDKIQLDTAHELQVFAFGDQQSNALVVFNLSRSASHTITVDGPRSPSGSVQVKTLTADRITANNEDAQNVQISTKQAEGVLRGKTVFNLPPFSMTVFGSKR